MGKKTSRVLKIYDKFLQGDEINKKKVAQYFKVDEKTIYRDISDISMYLQENKENKGDNSIEYKRSENGYVMLNKQNDSYILNKKHVLVISKILLESRAFCKSEINCIIKSLINKLDRDQKNYVNNLIQNELFNFVPLKHNQQLLDKIWELSKMISNKSVIRIKYKRIDKVKVERIINPVSIIFSEYYFYLIAYFNGFKYDNPTIFRIDRIIEYKETKETFHIVDSQRFQDGEFRKRIQFMYSGEIIKVVFEFYGKTIEPILERLPTAKIINKDENKYTIESEVFGKGIKMWILSQGSKIKVISPESFVKEISDEVSKIKELYT